MEEYLYYTMVALFITHELDAVRRREWRVLPLTAFFPDRIGEAVFIWAHIPIFLVMFLGGGLDPNTSFAAGLSVFAVIHVGLHWFFRKHRNYELNNPGSWALVVGTGIFGLAHLILVQ